MKPVFPSSHLYLNISPLITRTQHNVICWSLSIISSYMSFYMMAVAVPNPSLTSMVDDE